MKAFYFPHDDNAAGDERVLKLRVKFGNLEGYAMWFMLLEYMSRNKGCIDASAMQELCICYAVPAEKWKEFVTECTRIGLLQENQHVKFNPRLISALKEREKKKTLAKKAANVRWASEKTAYANAHANANADAMPGEERREEDRILKKPTKKNESLIEKPVREEKTDSEVLKQFFDIAENEQWTTEDYREAKLKQFYELGKDDKEEIVEKMRRMINCTFSKSESTKRLAKKIYHETVGLIQDRALDKSTIDGKTIAKRREYGEDNLEAF